MILESLDNDISDDIKNEVVATGSSCLLIVRGLNDSNNVSIHHDDSRETNSIIGHSVKTILNKEMMRIIKKVVI